MIAQRRPLGTSLRRATRLRRVALTVGQLGLGGTERQLVLLARGLKERGVEVGVASLFGGGPNVHPIRDAGIPLYLGDSPQRPEERAETPQFPRSLPRMARHLVNLPNYVSWLRRLRPQVVHAFLYHAYVLTPPAARLARVPVVVAGRRSLGDFKQGRRFALLIERMATAMTDMVIANSQAVADYTVREERLHWSKLRVIPNGLSGQVFETPRPISLRTDRPVVVSVANFYGYKGHEYLLDAAARLDAASRPVTLVLVGDGRERAQLERQAADRRLDVRFLGTRTDVPSVLAAADVVAQSSFGEGLSNAVLEAMAAGRPIVCTDIGGHREALDDCGILVPSRDSGALAEGIARLIDEPALAQTLADRARDRARRTYSQDAMVDAHIDTYEELLRTCAASPAS
jgi:L-malate glycosyltransferase